MKSFWMGAAAAAVVIGLSAAWPLHAQKALLIPTAPAAKDVPGAREMPDPNLVYKVVFVVGKMAPSITEVSPDLMNIARYVNTLADRGVAADHRKIAVVFHLDATDMIQENGAFKARHDGHDNANLALIESMTKAGVEFHVCGQAVLGKKIDPKTIVPQVQLDLWAMTTVTNLQLRGYVRAGG